MTTQATLVSTLGGQPQVVTLMLDLLIYNGHPIENVYIIYPSSNERYGQSFRKLAQEFAGNKYNNRTCYLHTRPVELENKPLSHIIDQPEINAVHDTLNSTLNTLKDMNHTIHLGLSGGRRIMSLVALTTAMFRLKPGDHLWHIFTPDEVLAKVKDGAMMHVPPEWGVRLIEVPFVPWIYFFRGQDGYQEALSNHYNLLGDDDHQRCQQVWDSLTLRQREILRALSAGLDRQEIADQFHITVATYDSHRSEILKKCEKVWIKDNEIFKERYWQALFSTFLKGRGLI